MPDHREGPWRPGERAWFEYHCWESPESGDAALWYHSHQRVTVEARAGDDALLDSTFAERVEAGQPRCYDVRFSDGLTGTALEDELTETRAAWCRPDPPRDPATSRAGKGDGDM